MANRILAPEAIVNTDRLLVIRYSEFFVDTATSSTTLVDISDSNFAHSNGTALASVNIQRIWGSVADAGGNADADIFWVANEGDLFIANLVQAGTGGGSMYYDYTTGGWGGIPKAGTDTGDATYGDIKLKCANLSSNEGVSVIIECRKNF